MTAESSTDEDDVIVIHGERLRWVTHHGFIADLEDGDGKSYARIVRRDSFQVVIYDNHRVQRGDFETIEDACSFAIAHVTDNLSHGSNPIDWSRVVEIGMSS